VTCAHFLVPIEVMTLDFSMRARLAWQNGFVNLGSKPVTRTTYDALYRSSSLDGGKIKAFYDAYKRAGLTPTEVDHAFFVDRAAHMSVSANDLDKAIAKLKANSPKWPIETWRARRTIANTIMAGNGDQRIDRLGRDVTFFVDAVGAANLSTSEKAAWANRGKRRSSDVGLSDTLPAPAFSPAAPLNAVPQGNPAAVPDEVTCPAAVLHTSSPPH
jgi:hypothetical protein